MPPFQELFNSQEFWSAVIISLIGGGGIVGALITAWSSRRSKAQEDRDSAEADKLATEAAQAAVQILTDSVIQPLREQVDKQAAQIQHLEEKQAMQTQKLEQTQQDLKEKQEEYFALGAYTRSLFIGFRSFAKSWSPIFWPVIRNHACRTSCDQTSHRKPLARRGNVIRFLVFASVPLASLPHRA